MANYSAPANVALCPMTNTKFAIGTAEVEAIRTTETSPETFWARYYSKITQYCICRFSLIANAADAIQAADSRVHDCSHDGQLKGLNNHLVSLFLFDRADGEMLKPNQTVTIGQGRPDDAVESPQS